MAIFHLNVKIISRTSGKSATAASAYTRAAKIKDHLLSKTFDYTRKKGVIYSEILAPVNSPAWVKNPEALWNRIELTEAQSKLSKKAQLAREIKVALPKELNLGQQIELLHTYIQKNFVSQGMVADFSIHHDNPNNPHAHILLTMRKLEGEHFGNKTREWNDRSFLKQWRKGWAEATNEHLQKAGFSQRITDESHETLGLKKKPTIHLGKKTTHALKRGIKLARALINDKIKSANSCIGLKEEVFNHGLFAHKESQPDPVMQEITNKLDKGKNLSGAGTTAAGG